MITAFRWPNSTVLLIGFCLDKNKNFSACFHQNQSAHHLDKKKRGEFKKFLHVYYMWFWPVVFPFICKACIYYKTRKHDSNWNRGHFVICWKLDKQVFVIISLKRYFFLLSLLLCFERFLWHLRFPFGLLPACKTVFLTISSKQITIQDCNLIKAEILSFLFCLFCVWFFFLFVQFLF